MAATKRPSSSRSKPSARAKTPRRPQASSPARALARGLEQAFTPAEAHEVLAAALLALGRPAQKKLCAELGSAGSTLAALLGLTGAASGKAGAVSPARLAGEWQSLWKQWDQIIKRTDDPEGPYIQNEISYTRNDLALDKLIADLDKVAAGLVPLLPAALGQPALPGPDPAKKITSSLDRIAPSQIAYLIVPEDVVPLGPATSKLLLTWVWQSQPDRAPGAKLASLGKALQALFDAEPAFGFDEKTLRSFFGALKAKERAELWAWLEKNREKEPWQEALDDDWGPAAPVVALLRDDE